MGKHLDKKHMWLVLALIASILILVFGIVTPLLYLSVSQTVSNKVVTSGTNTFAFDASAPAPIEVWTREEFEEFKAEDADVVTYDTYEEYIGSTSASFIESSATFSQEVPSVSNSNNITATGANAKLYNYCNAYFKCYYNGNRISPIFPMAIANVETDGRADHSKTWSSLFPSAIVDVSLIDTFNVTDVLSDEKIFKALTSDYSTRDRGALQMSPTYGAGDASVNKQMSGSEVSKLKSVDTSAYSAWCSGAASQAGDRFYIPDMLLRMQAAMNYNLSQFKSKGYEPHSDFQMLAMLSIGHNSGSGVFSQSNPNKHVGNWISANKCYEWCSICSSDKFIEMLRSYYAYSGAITIDSKTTERLLNKFNSTLSYREYTTSRINAYYPIEFLYTYIALCDLYTR